MRCRDENIGFAIADRFGRPRMVRNSGLYGLDFSPTGFASGKITRTIVVWSIRGGLGALARTNWAAGRFTTPTSIGRSRASWPVRSSACSTLFAIARSDVEVPWLSWNITAFIRSARLILPPPTFPGSYLGEFDLRSPE